MFLDNLLWRGCGTGSNYPFLTLKERDIETGPDFFEARYYSSVQGRFTSPDPLTASGDPALLIWCRGHLLWRVVGSIRVTCLR